MGSHPKSSPYHDVDAPDWYALGRYRASPPGERGYNSSIPTPRERRSPSVTDRSEKTSAGQAAPTMHTGGSTASLLQPPPTILHRYSQISLSQTSLGGGFTATQNRRVSKPIQDCAIVRFHERDDVEQWSGLKRYVYRLAPFLILADVLLYLVYLGLRLYCNIDVQRKTNIDAGPAWVFVAVELLITIPFLMNNFWAMFALKKRNRPRLRLAGDDVPTVDVLVTCCREDDGVIMDTVRGACDQDYPTDRFRVIILDDGGSESLEKLAYEASQMFPNLYYRARQKIAGVPHHFKAGNLNYGLEQGTFLPGGASEFVAALDADMIPEPEWLRAILPHLLQDRKMGMACPPQLFYNTPRSDPLGQSLDFFVHVTEPIKDTLGAAWCTGSGYICRREAIKDIGGIPLGSVAEDVATSNLMIGKGWTTAYVHEPLQFGTVPEDFLSHLKQRTRWAIGTVENAVAMRFYLWGEKIKHMSTRARLTSSLIAFLSLYPILFTIALFSLPVILALGRPLVIFTNDDQFRWLIRACFASVASRRIMEFILFIPSGYHTGQRYTRYHIWMAPYLALCLIRAFFLPKWLGGTTAAFKPTGSLGSALNERDAATRRGLFRRLWAILLQCMAIFHLLFVYFIVACAVVVTYKAFIVERGVSDILRHLVTHAWWPPLTFVFLCNSFWIPIAYAINPPTVPDREELLNRDPNTGIAHPREVTKKTAFGAQAAWLEFEYTLTTIYSALVFAATFFLF